MCRQGKTADLYVKMYNDLMAYGKASLMSLSSDEDSIAKRFKDQLDLDVIVEKKNENIFLISLKTVDNEKQEK